MKCKSAPGKILSRKSTSHVPYTTSYAAQPVSGEIYFLPTSCLSHLLKWHPNPRPIPFSRDAKPFSPVGLKVVKFYTYILQCRLRVEENECQFFLVRVRPGSKKEEVSLVPCFVGGQHLSWNVVPKHLKMPRNE